MLGRRHLEAVLAEYVDHYTATARTVPVTARLASHTDALTGLFDRRAWDQVVQAEDARLVRLADPAVVVSIGVDGPKVISDAREHHTGDLHRRAGAATLA